MQLIFLNFMAFAASAHNNVDKNNKRGACSIAKPSAHNATTPNIALPHTITPTSISTMPQFCG
jgi:hypothetical protein